MKTALGIMKPISDSPYCEAIRLVPFTVDQIREALREQKELVRNQICSLAQSEARFLDLISRPSLLHVVSVLWEKDELYKKAELLNSAYVMERFVRSSYRRQGLKAEGSRDFMALNSSERDYFMCGIASYMAAEQLSNQISNEQLKELINKLIDTIPDSVSIEVPEISNEDSRPLKQRSQTPDDIEHIRTDVRTCGLLVDDPSALGIFKFGHKSFMEYLFAKTVKEYINWNSDPAKARAIKEATSFPLECILDLPVSLGFLSEMIGTEPSAKQTSSSINSNLRVATRLLYIIFNPTNILLIRFVIHFLLFNYSYIESGKKYKSFKKLLILFTSPIVIIYSIASSTLLLFFLFSRFSSTEITPNASTLLSVTTLSVLSASFTLSIQYIFLNLKSNSQRRKFHLWNSLCKELQIEDQVLHQVARTSCLPWTKNQPFDYFLKKPK